MITSTFATRVVITITINITIILTVTIAMAITATVIISFLLFGVVIIISSYMLMVVTVGRAASVSDIQDATVSAVVHRVALIASD